MHLYARADSLRLSVSDNGPGMDPATLARLGEPFFTTKTTGTGLGLAGGQGRGARPPGQLQLRSRPGRGTCATLILPLIPAAPSLRFRSNPMAAKVLLVEDDRALREALSDTLLLGGHEFVVVDSAEGGAPVLAAQPSAW
ncbi:ATP-binding protein [Klebsiella pneumoniae]